MFHNGDTRKQLLARSRYLLYKAQNNWTNSQGIRAKILFKQYPEIQKAYQLVQGLREIFNLKTSMQIAYTKLAHWYKQVENSGFNQFKSIVNTITLNYFVNRSTNASAESSMLRLKPLELNLEVSEMSNSSSLD